MDFRKKCDFCKNKRNQGLFINRFDTFNGLIKDTSFIVKFEGVKDTITETVQIKVGEKPVPTRRDTLNAWITKDTLWFTEEKVLVNGEWIYFNISPDEMTTCYHFYSNGKATLSWNGYVQFEGNWNLIDDNTISLDGVPVSIILTETNLSFIREEGKSWEIYSHK